MVDIKVDIPESRPEIPGLSIPCLIDKYFIYIYSGKICLKLVVFLLFIWHLFI